MASSSATSHPTPAPQGVPSASAGGGFKLKFKLGGLSASATSSSSSGSASTNRVALASSSAPSVVPSVVPSHSHARAHAPAANTTPVASTSTLSSYPTVSAAGPSIIKLTQPSITLAHHHHHHHHRKPAAPSLSAHPVTATATTAATTTTAAPQRNRASSDASTSTSSSEASGSSVPSSPVVERPRPSSSLPPIALSSARPVIVRKPEPRDPEVQHKLDREFRGVTSAKYRKLKRAYDEVVETRDQAQYTLHRSQKIISRLQDEKRSLLDRVQLLERAAGITTSVAQQASSTSATPLLDPPSLPSLADRPRELPLLTTATDITDSSYADPVGPKLLPSDLPPRRRSHHLTTHLAAEKLKESPEARERAAAVASKNEFALVSLLGAQGAEIAENVTRALNGEKVGVVQVVVAGPATSTSTTTTSSGKRKRDGPSSNSKKSSMSTVQPKSHEHLSALPNPFAAAGATPLPDPIDPFPHLVGADNDLFDDSINSPALSRDGFGAITDDDDPYDIKPGTPSSSALAMPVPAPSKKAAPHKKAKRQKVSVVTPGVHTIPFVPRYGDGQPILPLPFGTMVLRNLGTVDHRDAFHTERYIFPVGYEASRKYPSMIDPKTTVEYVCKVIEGDNNGPQFEVYPEDQPGVVITGTTATSAWSQIVKAVNVIRSRSQSNSVSGPDYFGLSHNLVKALVQELPGANQVVSYIWQTFVEDPDPALAEANKKRNRSSASVGPMMDGVGLSGPGGLRRSTMDGMPGDYGLSPMMYPSSTGSPGNPSVFDPTLHQPQHYGSPIQHSSSSFNPSLMHSHSGANDPYALPSGSPSASTSSYYAPDPYAIPPSSSNAWGVDPSLDSTYGHRSSHHHHLMHHDTSLDPSFTTSTDSSSSLSHNPYGLPPPNF
ncbi:BQ5605_C008g05290 [Microbotryum silenes-dioicae]|uniref:BQ5605_C008g05290 protein n=1 Tax=Microbotryum silenes-dioicae TaxID=796604 RepID=A0A2X0MGU4_9BASI|nr:BQ5605_C008g05290 [Microbotryum silenes-dioicae]